MLHKNNFINLRRLLMMAFTALLVTTGIVFVPAQKAEAGTYQYCKGYSACSKQSKTNHSYSSNLRKSYWRMHPGHNCTNYVAYMMVKAGAGSGRPAALKSGNGYGWGVSFKKKMNKTPAMGSVAWWGKGKGYGSTGHVAYVERVISSSEILVSEEGSLGFRWRKITKSGAGWPSGFIHIKDAPAYKAQIVSQKVYTNETLKTVANSENLTQGDTAWVAVTYQNVGGKNWGALKVSTEKDSPFYSERWVDKTIPKTSSKTITYGKNVTFVFPVTIPKSSKASAQFIIKYGNTVIGSSVFTVTVSAKAAAVVPPAPAPAPAPPVPTVEEAPTAEN